jgi:hypothetical protein
MRSIVERRTFRLGVLVLAFTAMNLSLAMTGPLDHIEWGAWLMIAAAGVTGIGLLVHARVARAIAGVAVAVAGVLTLVSLAGLPGRVTGLAALQDWTPLVLGAVANTVATALLGVWFCIRAIQALLGRPWAATLVTARLTGAALAVIAAHHLWLAAMAEVGLGLGSLGGIGISISESGTQLAGFPGWPIWHCGLAIIALMMLAGPRRLVSRAATLLVVWCACLVVLVLIDLPQLMMLLVPFTVLLALILTYLAWWLRDEVRRVLDPSIEG